MDEVDNRRMVFPIERLADLPKASAEFVLQAHGYIRTGKGKESCPALAP